MASIASEPPVSSAEKKRKRIIMLDDDEDDDEVEVVGPPRVKKGELGGGKARPVARLEDDEDEDDESDDGSYHGEEEDDDDDDEEDDDEEDSEDDDDSGDEDMAELVDEDPLSEVDEVPSTPSSAASSRKKKKARGSRDGFEEEEGEGQGGEKLVLTTKRSKVEEMHPFAELSGILEVIINAKRIPGVCYAYMDRLEFWCDGDNHASLVVRHEDLKSIDFFEKLTDEGSVGASDGQKPGQKYKFELCIKLTLKSGQTRSLQDSGDSDRVIIRRLYRQVKEASRGQGFHRDRIKHLKEFEAFISKVKGRRESRFPINIKSFGVKAQACGSGADRIRDFQELRVSKKEISDFSSKHSLVINDFDKVVFRPQGESVTMVCQRKGKAPIELKSISRSDEKNLRQWLKDELPKVPVFG